MKVLNFGQNQVIKFSAVLVLMMIPALLSGTVITFAGFPDMTVLTTQDFGDGATFDGTVILTCCNSDGSGSLNDAFFPPPADDGGATDGVNIAYNPSGPLTLTFIDPSAFFTADFTYNDGLTVTAYDASMNVLSSVDGACGASGSGGGNYVGSGCGAPNEVIDINTPEISRIVVTGGEGNNFTIDDVNFTGAVNAGVGAPEPGTIAMAFGGLCCLALFGRRRRGVNS
jgi:hypothetical protein